MQFKKNILIKYISWLFVIIWMIIIFILSNAPSNVSGSSSKNIIQSTIKIALNITNKVGITNYHPTNQELNKESSYLNEPLRECMHSFVYFILAILLINALNKTNINKMYLVAIYICIIYAISDETHQIFIKGRGFELLDIILDTIGSLLGLSLYRFIHKTKYKNIWG